MARLGLPAALIGVLLASGCGSATKTVTTPAPETPAQAGAQSALRASIGVGTPALQSNGAFATRYTCQGGNVSLPLRWAGVDPKAKELVLLVRSFVTLRQSTYNWAVAGISPTLQHVEAGKLPSGAIVGRNSFGQNAYNLCLAKGAQHMLVTVDVLSLPQTANLKPGFDPSAMQEQVRSPGVGWGSVVGYIGAPAK